jgi:putative transposase
VDGLKGFPEAIESVYPRTEVQLCIVHLVRASLHYVNWKQRTEVAADLRLIYPAGTATEAEMRLDEFARKWDAVYPMVSQVWRRSWERITPFFAYPGEIRKVIYTTNTIESLNMSLRKIIKMRGSFPNEDAAMKLLYLALRNASKKKLTMPVQNWSGVLNRFSILWPERMPALKVSGFILVGGLATFVLLSRPNRVHKISQAYPGIPTVTERQSACDALTYLITFARHSHGSRG